MGTFHKGPKFPGGKWALFFTAALILTSQNLLQAQQWTSYTSADGLADNYVLAIHEATDGALWFATFGGGISRFDGTWQSFTTQDGLADDLVWAIFETADGDLWIRTLGAGVSRFDGVSWQSFTTQDGLADDFVNFILEKADGSLWFTTGAGISRFDGTWRTFTTDDGLGDNFIRSIIEAADGTLWAATNGGISRFDENFWQTFTTGDGLAGDEVSTILEAADGTLWAATNGGISHYDGNNWESFTTGDILDGEAVETKLVQYIEILEESGQLLFVDGEAYLEQYAQSILENVRFIFQASDGALWFASGRGASRFDGNTWQTFIAGDILGPESFADFDLDLRSILETADGSLWFKTRDKGLMRFDGDTWQVFAAANGLPGNLVGFVVEVADGSLWVSVAGAGVSRFAGNTWKTFTTIDGLVDDDVSSVLQAADGALWFATTGGVSRFDGNTWKTFTMADIVADSPVLSFVNVNDTFINSAFAAADGTLWAAASHVLSRFDGTSWQSFSPDDGVAGFRVGSVFQTADGTLWAGTNGGVSYFDGTFWQAFGARDGLADDLVHSLLETANGDLWVSTRQGLSRFDGNVWTTFTTADGVAGDNVWDMLETANGNLWVISTRAGASRFDGETWQAFTPEDGLASDEVDALYEAADGSMWFATENGVSRFDGAWQTFSSENGLPDDEVNAILQTSDGALWVATDGGVGRFQDKTWLIFTSQNGLAGDEVNAILQTSDGALWVTTDGGVSRFDGETWQSFTIADGLAGNQTVWLLEATDGTLWVTTDGGVSRFGGETWQAFTTEDGLADNRVRSMLEAADGSMWFVSFRGMSRYRRPPRPLVQTLITRLPPTTLGSDRFFFEFQGVEIGSRRPPRLSYALVSGTGEPRDHEWSRFAAITGFEATGLADGEWTLHVRAIDRNGHVDPTPAKTAFLVDVTPPTVVISSPAGTVHGQVEIVGSVFDNSARPDLMDFALEYGSGTAQDQVDDAAWSRDRIYDRATDAVVNGLLGVWDTEGLHGPHVLRLAAVDSLGHRSTYAVALDIVAAAVEIDPRLGGRVGDDNSAATLYIPPNGIERNVQITITPVDEDKLRLAADPRLTFAGSAYRLEPETLTLGKPATLSFALADEVPVGGERQLALFIWSPATENWTRVGGSLALEERRLSAAIDRLGIYALFVAELEEGEVTLSDLACQPRMISPRGGGFAQRMDISFDLGGPTAVSVRIYDMAGNLVRHLVEDEPLFPGSNVTTWDGRDAEERIVHDGAYIVIVEAANKRAKKVVTVIDGQR